MSALLISYDLNKPGQKYERLYEKIKALGTWWHYLDSTRSSSRHSVRAKPLTDSRPCWTTPTVCSSLTSRATPTRAGSHKRLGIGSVSMSRRGKPTSRSCGAGCSARKGMCTTGRDPSRDSVVSVRRGKTLAWV